MRFAAEKTDGGKRKGKLSLYCRVLEISREGFYRYLARQGRPWKYQGLADTMRAIHEEDLCNDTYGRTVKKQFELPYLKKHCIKIFWITIVTG